MAQSPEVSYVQTQVKANPVLLHASEEPLAKSRSHLYFSPSRLRKVCFSALLQPGRSQDKDQTMGFEYKFLPGRVVVELYALSFSDVLTTAAS